MTKIVKDALKHVRTLCSREIALTLEATEARLNTKMEAIERTLHDTQLTINHHQTGLLQELKERTKNSGTIALSENEIITKIFSGLKMYLDPNDLAITPHLALDGIWEHRVTAAWLAVVQPQDVVIEIGSNNGYYGALAAQKTDKKNSKVIMFEANPNLIPYIRKTLAVNWLNEQTVLENVAISDKEGELVLHILQDYIGSSSVRPNAEIKKYMGSKMRMETAEEVKVKATSIDVYCKKHKIPAVDLFLMDIEGYEDIAYAGMRKTIAASPNATLFVEFTPQGYKDPEGFYNQMLKDFGHVYMIDDDGYIVKPKTTSYGAVIGNPDDWVMPIFSKKANLANH